MRSPSPPKKVENMVTEVDRRELERHYLFAPDETTTFTWQGRMVQHYHTHLYKDYVVGDFSQLPSLGLRWRTAKEVREGRASRTCANKHCPASSAAVDPAICEKALKDYDKGYHNSEDEERSLIQKQPHGTLLTSFEVPFRYNEDGQSKLELVQMVLCMQCAPLLFISRGSEQPCLDARRARTSATFRDEESSSESNDAKKRKKHRKRSRKDERKHKKKRRLK